MAVKHTKSLIGKNLTTCANCFLDTFPECENSIFVAKTEFSYSGTDEALRKLAQVVNLNLFTVLSSIIEMSGDFAKLAIFHRVRMPFRIDVAIGVWIHGLGNRNLA